MFDQQSGSVRCKSEALRRAAKAVKASADLEEKQRMIGNHDVIVHLREEVAYIEWARRIQEVQGPRWMIKIS